MRRRHHFSIARKFVFTGQFVFLDESGAQTNMTRRYGRAPVGERCVDFTPHGHWKTQTLLSAIRCDGVIRQATLILDGPVNSHTFIGYTQQCLAPALRPGDVVVMDNLAAHKTTAVQEAIAAVGADVWYLPPYSPDLNPIEKLWSKVKSWLRSAQARSLPELFDHVAQALSSVTPQECQNYFRSCGYGY